MRLIPLDTPELIARAAGWLAEKENLQWLDFGGGRQQLTPALVRIMAQRDTNVLRVFTADDGETPIGVVGLQNVDRRFKTAAIWVVLGDREHGGRFYPSRAVSKMLTYGFRELGLGAISTWTVEHNRSVLLARRLNFHFIGRQRQCHYIDGRAYDRLLFDILPSEHSELEAVRYGSRRDARAPGPHAARAVDGAGSVAPEPQRQNRPAARGGAPAPGGGRAAMRLVPLDTPELIARVAGWLAEKENFQWLDFGGGPQQLTPALVRIMAQRDTNVLRIFTADDGETPIGVVSLQNVDRHFKTATLWAVLGDKSFVRRGYATRAVSKMLALGFGEMGLDAVNTWAVEHNPSVEIARRIGFRYVGRLRRCHYIGGRAYDRLLFDILPSEYAERRDG